MVTAPAWIALMVMNAAGAPAAGGAWLDASPPASWNLPGGKLPKAPPAEPLDPHLRKQCGPLVRPATSAADRAATAAGWKLFGAAQRFGDVEVITGQSSVDGMCRPWGYQVLVFVGGRFAGTASPRPMDARTDGSAQAPVLSSADALYVEFSRYAATDPMCCPSRTSTARYRVERRKEGPVVVLSDVTTTPTGDGATASAATLAPTCQAPPAQVAAAAPAAITPATPSAAATPPEPTGRRWQLVRIQMMDDSVLVPEAPERYTLELGPDGKAAVRADCNRGSGGYTLKGSALTFGPMATTRAMCPPGSLSDRYLQQLSFVASWTARDGRLFLATRADGAILEFAPAP